MEELEKYKEPILEIIHANCALSKEQNKLQSELNKIQVRLKEIIMIKAMLEENESNLINKIEAEIGKKVTATGLFSFLTNKQHV